MKRKLTRAQLRRLLLREASKLKKSMILERQGDFAEVDTEIDAVEDEGIRMILRYFFNKLNNSAANESQ